MEREERRRKFNESLKQILFPPPQEINIEELPNLNPNDLIPDELGELGTASSSDDERECGSQKPTRAQRKRVRKKKLKEDNKRRNGMIGPLTAASDGDKGVRRNAAEKLNYENDPPGDIAPCTNQNKVKHRRRAKKLAKEKPNSSTLENPQQDCDSTTNIKS